MKLKIPAPVLHSVHANLAARAGRARPVANWVPIGSQNVATMNAGVKYPQMHIRNLADGEPEIYIYDEISWWGVNSDDVRTALDSLGQVEQVSVRINSPGGDAFDGVAIYNMLLDHPAKMKVTVDAMALSAASVIAMAGDEVVVNSAGRMMIHDASGLCWGNPKEMRQFADVLDGISQSIAEVYADRCGGTVAEWRERMEAESWYGATEAVEVGLADSAVTRGPRKAPADAEPDEPVEDKLAVRPWAWWTQEGRIPQDVITTLGEPEPTKPATPVLNWDPDLFRTAIRNGARA